MDTLTTNSSTITTNSGSTYWTNKITAAPGISISRDSTGSLFINGSDLTAELDQLYVRKDCSKVTKDDYFTIKDGDEFTKVVCYVPRKVFEFTFADGTVIKTVRDKEDEFDLDFAFYLALAKKLYSGFYTLEGIMHRAETLKYETRYYKLVEKGKKLYRDSFLKEIGDKIKESEKAHQHQKYIEKKKRRDERKAKQAKEELKQIIIEAIKEAKPKKNFLKKER